jgi:hypothetical protein
LQPRGLFVAIPLPNGKYANRLSYLLDNYLYQGQSHRGCDLAQKGSADQSDELKSYMADQKFHFFKPVYFLLIGNDMRYHVSAFQSQRIATAR